MTIVLKTARNVLTDFRTVSFMLADDMLGSSNPGLKTYHLHKITNWVSTLLRLQCVDGYNAECLIINHLWPCDSVLSSVPATADFL